MSATAGGIPRRNLLGLVGGGAAVLGIAGCREQAAGPSSPNRAAVQGSTPQLVAFHGEHQAGVVTTPPRLLMLVAFNLRRRTGAADDLRRLLRLWTDTARRLTAGEPALADLSAELGSDPANLTVTVGLGRGALVRSGLTHRAPSWLKTLPPLRIDELEQQWGEADVVLQLCSDAEMSLAHAGRLLMTDANPFATVRWTQKGFRSAPDGTQNRNLFGQVDGTINPTEAEADSLVWVPQHSGPTGWLSGGASMVVRRISMDMVKWEEVDRDSREAAIGRTLADGSPLSGGRPQDAVDLEHKNPETGLLTILPGAHTRRAVTGDSRQRILRRPYNYEDVASTGIQSGLVFIAFQRDPVQQFLPIQRRLAEMDILNLWTTPRGSAVFAVLPGCRSADEYLGQALLE